MFCTQRGNTGEDHYKDNGPCLHIILGLVPAAIWLSWRTRFHFCGNLLVVVTASVLAMYLEGERCAHGTWLWQMVTVQVQRLYLPLEPPPIVPEAWYLVALLVRPSAHPLGKPLRVLWQGERSASLPLYEEESRRGHLTSG
jgi:hypothetical protein